MGKAKALPAAQRPFRLLRKAFPFHVTQQDLADRAKCDRPYFVRIENGTLKATTTEAVERIARAFGLPRADVEAFMALDLRAQLSAIPELVERSALYTEWKAAGPVAKPDPDVLNVAKAARLGGQSLTDEHVSGRRGRRPAIKSSPE